MVPGDLLAFWNTARKELDNVPLNAAVEESPDLSGREYNTCAVRLDSLGGVGLRGWYSVPKDPPRGGRFPAVLAVPGYGGDKPIPTHLVVSGFAVLTLFPRGQGESRQEWELEHDTKLTYHIMDKERYYYRGGYMDCVRGMDFLCMQQEVDPGRVGMWSRSQGGGLTLATAALDQRLQVAIAEEPFLCNFPESIGITTTPYRELHDYLAAYPDRREKALETLAYFDPLNLASGISCPTLVNIGMADQTCPYRTIMPVFERIPGVKAVYVYPELAHSPCTDFNAHAMGWLKRYLGA